jgi:PAS domain S-box-containing protein
MKIIDGRIIELKVEYDNNVSRDSKAQQSAIEKTTVGFCLLELLILVLTAVELAAVGRIQMDKIRMGEEDDRYRQLIESAGDAVFLTDAETGIILDVNKAAETMMGDSRENIIGKHQTKLHPPDRVKEYSSIFKTHVQSGGKDVLRSLLVRRVDGTDVPVDIRASIFRLDGRTLIQGIFRDMTYYVQSARKIKEQADFLQLLMHAIPNAVYYKDARGRYLGCNHAFEKLFGVTSAGIIGKTAFEVHPREVAERYNDKDQELYKSPKHMQVYEAMGKVADGSLRNMVFYKSCFFDTTGQVAGIVGVGLDITEKKELERQQVELVTQTVDALEEAREERKKAEEANRLKSEFLANMSHELHTPLTSVLGYSRIVSDRCDDISGMLARMSQLLDANGNPENARGEEAKTLMKSAIGGLEDASTFNGVVIEQGRRLFALINDLLDLSLLESGHMKVADNVVSTFMILASLGESMHDEATAKDLKLVTDIDNFRAIDLVFLGDAKKLEQVLINLVQNAIKYSVRGEVRITAGTDDGHVVFRVKDEGIGIPDRERELIFESFRQLDGSTTRARGGVGLGLSLAKSLMTAMGGTIDVKSKPGKGSEFTITLPYRKVENSVA